jgi:hypothetical protein
MDKYAALTALAIALITMLALAVSASGEPRQCILLRGGSFCNSKCQTELWYTENLWDFTRIRNCAPHPLLDACLAKCMAEKKAAQH